jgi:hypothetical protein
MKIHSNLAVSDNGFIFNPYNGDSFSTNNVGADLIRLLKENKSMSQIMQSLLETYDVDPILLEKDVEDFIAQLKDHYLVNHD